MSGRLSIGSSGVPKFASTNRIVVELVRSFSLLCLVTTAAVSVKPASSRARRGSGRRNVWPLRRHFHAS